MLPVVSIAICIYMGWRSPKGLLDNQLTNGGTMRSHVTTIVMFIIRWVAPVLIATILISNFI
jgi:NSS family neurotransmitter:Na+ symporter